MKGVDNHHVFFNRAWYKSPIEKAFRQHPGLVIPMHVPVHRELHAELPPPPKPHRELMLGALVVLDNMSIQSLTQPTDAALALSDYFLTRDENVAQRIGQNLLQQVIYIAAGYYAKEHPS